MNTQDDERCCGTGTCIIDAQGNCWCGQKWDGEKMCYPTMARPPDSVELKVTETPPQAKDADTQ